MNDIIDSVEILKEETNVAKQRLIKAKLRASREKARKESQKEEQETAEQEARQKECLNEALEAHQNNAIQAQFSLGTQAFPQVYHEEQDRKNLQ